MNSPKLGLYFASKLVEKVLLAGSETVGKYSTFWFCKKELWTRNNLISQVNTKVGFWALLCGKTNRNEKEEEPE